MSVKLSTAVRNAKLDSVEATVSTAPILKIFTGAAPANCAAADSGTLLASMALPSDWMAAASGGAKALAGSWTDTDANASGTAGHFRIYDSGGSTCHLQGAITASGGGGDMIIDNVAITEHGTVTITAFTLTEGNA